MNIYVPMFGTSPSAVTVPDGREINSRDYSPSRSPIYGKVALSEENRGIDVLVSEASLA
jgi:hypothetical protein